MTLVRLPAALLSRASWHEAGHAIVGLHYGLRPAPVLFPDGYIDPDARIGHCHIPGASRLPLLQRRALAVAGYIGEWQAGTQPPASSFSPRDREFAGPCSDDELAAAAVEARRILVAREVEWRRLAYYLRRRVEVPTRRAS